MKEIQNILRLYENIDNDGQYAMATVVYIEGSSYRRPGARMLITTDGKWEGGISGGCLEGDALQKAQNVIHTGRPRLVTYDNREEDPFQLGVSLGCKGLISVLLEPIDRSSDIMESLKQIIENRTPTIIGHVINQSESADLGQRIVWNDGQQLQSSMDSSLIKALQPYLTQCQSDQTGTRVSVNGVDVSLEYIRPNNRLLVVGGSYDAYPMIRAAHELGWQVHMMANTTKMRREAFDICQKTWNEKTTTEDQINKDIDRYTAVLLMNHDIDRDGKWLMTLLPYSAFYIGMLGPKIRADELLQKMNIDSSQYPQLHYPIGLDIGAEGPEEIAISVLSEIIAAQNQRSAGYLKARKTPIYDNPR